jgi:predicted transglutaminase-like cysteine proteinase
MLCVAILAGAAGAPFVPARAFEPAVGIFGFTELQHEGGGPLTQWPRVLARYEIERQDARLPCTGGHCHVAGWLAFLDTLRARPLSAQMRAVNDLVNSAAYVDDVANYGTADYWATPGEFFHRHGDCEDFAIVKYLSLLYLGTPVTSLRVVTLVDEAVHSFHAVLAVYDNSEIWILDNKSNEIRPAAKINHYLPLVSMTMGSWWLHASAIDGGAKRE